MKTIEGVWNRYKSACESRGMPQASLDVAEVHFYCGATALFTEIASKLNEPGQAREESFSFLTGIYDEINEFLTEEREFS